MRSELLTGLPYSVSDHSPASASEEDMRLFRQCCEGGGGGVWNSGECRKKEKRIKSKSHRKRNVNSNKTGGLGGHIDKTNPFWENHGTRIETHSNKPSLNTDSIGESRHQPNTKPQHTRLKDVSVYECRVASIFDLSTKKYTSLL